MTSTGALVFLAVVTFFVPLVGIVAGLLGLGSGSDRKRAESLGLLLFGLTTAMMYLLVFLR